MGTTGGAWTTLSTLAENSTRPLRDEKWYFIWVLDKKAPRRS